MDEVTAIGIDLAKSVFQLHGPAAWDSCMGQLHGVDANGRPSLRRQFRRGQMLEFSGVSRRA